MPNTGPTAWNFPDFFVGKTQALSAYEPYANVTSSGYSSLPPTTAAVVRWEQPGPVAMKNVVVLNSLNAGVPGATSQASTGSEAFTYAYNVALFSRQDYSGNSTNWFPQATGSMGLSASLGYSSTSQQFGMSWVTDSTGGTSNFTTTSSDAAWSNFASGPRFISIPLVTTLPSGEWWMAFNQASTSATSNSNVTLLSMSMLQQSWNSITMGGLGASATVLSTGLLGGFMPTPLTTSTTMAMSGLSGTARPIWFAFSNV